MRKPNAKLIALLLILAASLFVLACDLASIVTQTGLPLGQGKNQTKGDNLDVGQTPAASAGKTSAPPAAKDAQSRISDSLNRLLIMETKALDSYHLEASGTEPVWNKDTQKIETETFTFKADVSGDNVHFIQVVKAGKETTTDGYIMNATAKDGGKGYAVENGKVKEDLFMPLAWVMLPLDWGMPLIYASMGPTARGEEAVDGRAADKFDIDIAKAPTGTEGVLKGLGFVIYSSKGTAWIDKQSSALLKMNIDYERDVIDTSGSGKVAGKGAGRIELVVTQVGKVQVTLPATSQGTSGTSATPVSTKAGGATTVPTKGGPTSTATKTGTTRTPTRTGAKQAPTATPAPTGVRVGQRITKEGMTFTVTKVETVDKGASAGSTWLIVHLNVENTGSTDAYLYLDSFAFLDKAGGETFDLTNGPSAPSAYSDNVLDFEQLAPGEKVNDKLLLRQFKKTEIPGLRLEWTGEEDNMIVWNLGL